MIYQFAVFGLCAHTDVKFTSIVDYRASKLVMNFAYAESFFIECNIPSASKFIFPVFA